jgi:hypothetical protein
MSYSGKGTSGLPLVGQGTSTSKYAAVGISGGGTNATSFATDTGIVKYDGTRLVTSSAATIDASDIVLNTSQTSFMAYNANTVANVTGDATVYTCQFDTEIFDIGSNFASNIFTAPVTGTYLFSAGISVSGLAAHTLISMRLLSSTTLFFPIYLTPTLIHNAGVIQYCGSANLRMIPTQTCRLQIVVSGSTKTVSWNGAAIGSNPPYFSGCLLC